MTWHEQHTNRPASTNENGKESDGTALTILAAAAIGGCCAGPLLVAALIAAAKSVGAPLLVLVVIAAIGIGGLWVWWRKRANSACCPSPTQTIEHPTGRAEQA